jgi:hypothetical protein
LDQQSGPIYNTAQSYKYQADMLSRAKIISLPDTEIQIAAATAAGGEERVFFRASDGEGNLGLFIWEQKTGKARRVSTEEDG